MDTSSQRNKFFWIPLVWAILPALAGADTESLSPHVRVSRGAVNGVCIEREGHALVVYGDPQQSWKTADMVLFTHGRRDVVWAGRSLVESGASAVIPAREAEQFAQAGDFWTAFWDRRFHDYTQESTKVPVAPLRVDRVVKGGDELSWQDLAVRVLDTPGYTRGAVSYFVEVDGRRYGFVGDLIYGDGHLLDLYSLQDAVPQTRIGGYHGYAGRTGELLASLRRVAAEKPDILVPARGPVIREPATAIAKLIERLQCAYENYLSISAGRWYFRDQYDVLATRALGSPDRVGWMPYAKTIEKAPPDWIIPLDNSRLILSADRSGFLVDCGSRAIIERTRQLKNNGRLSMLDGLFITHYHDDHTDKVNELVQEFACPIYVTPILEDVLKRPGAYRLPCLTPNAITQLRVVPDGHHLRWKEFGLTFYDFPGQTLYHDALLVEKETGGRIFFVGDSFTPSGLDDYCLQNRNFLHPQTGFLYCLDLLQRQIPADALLINEHVLEPFRFGPDQRAQMRRLLQKRGELLRDLFPWDDPDYGIDEQWARVDPYAQEVKAGSWVQLSVKLLNHSATPNTFTVIPNAPGGFEVEPRKTSVTAGPGQEAEARFRLRTPSDGTHPLYVLTADVQVGPWDLHEWCEALVKVLP
jgi:glyoxylase-like metal-dependent hydrolase (beta-lactamase superfamily II)